MHMASSIHHRSTRSSPIRTLRSSRDRSSHHLLANSIHHRSTHSNPVSSMCHHSIHSRAVRTSRLNEPIHRENSALTSDLPGLTSVQRTHPWGCPLDITFYYLFLPSNKGLKAQAMNRITHWSGNKRTLTTFSLVKITA